MLVDREAAFLGDRGLAHFDRFVVKLLHASALDAQGTALAELELLATIGRRLGRARPALAKRTKPYRSASVARPARDSARWLM